jgi:hypothetical protein
MSNIKDILALNLAKTSEDEDKKQGCNSPFISQNMPASIIFKDTNSHVNSKD